MSIATLRRYLRTPKAQFAVVLLLLTMVAASATGWLLVLPTLLGAIGVAMLLDALVMWRRDSRWSFPDGAMLTAWIVALIVSPYEPWYVAAVTAGVGVASKYLWRVKRANVLNPAAFALVATFYVFDTGQSWWGALPELPLAWTVVLFATGVYTAIRLNKLPVILAFLAVFFVLATGAAYVGDPQKVAELFRAPDLHAALFFAFFMVTDPPTSPPKHRDQLLYGAITAVAGYLVFQFVGAAYFLLAGLLVANVWEGWRKSHR